jgi:membrane protein
LRNVEGPKRGVISLVIGLVTLLFGATTAFVQLQTALNRIWDVKATAAKERNAIWALVRDRLLSLMMILGVGFLLLVSLVISAGLSAAGEWFGGRMSLDPRLWQVINTIVSFGIVTVLIAMIFKFLPDAKIRWRDVAFGSVLTALLFTGGKYAIGLYLGRASIGSAYGAAGSVVVLMVWVYYASLIFFLGAEITYVRTRRRRGSTQPADYAEKAPPQGRT